MVKYEQQIPKDINKKKLSSPLNLSNLMLVSFQYFFYPLQYAFCNKRSHGTKSATLEGKLIIPALGC